MKFLIIGLGSMGKRRIRCLKHLGEEDIIGFDTRGDRCEEVNTKYDIKVQNDWDNAAKEDADVWIISTPPDLHMYYALQAVERNIHFFTEANVCDERLEELTGLIDKKTIVGVPSCTMRYFEGVKQIKDSILADEIGKPLSFTYHWGQYLPDWHPWESYKDFYVSKIETGACREIVPFILVWLTDVFGDISKLSCFKNKITDLETGIDDIYQMLLQFNNGVMGHLQVDVLSRPAIHFIRINGSKGTLEWNHHENILKQYNIGSNEWKLIEINKGDVEEGYLYAEEPYVEEMNAFIDEINGKKNYPYSYKDDLKIIGLLQKSEYSNDNSIHVEELYEL